MDLLLVLALGLAAGTISGIVGFGSSIMLMPALVLVYGPLQAVPIMAISATMANLARLLAWWREIDWRLCGAYAVTAAPAAALGAGTLLVLPPPLIEIALGIFFIAMIRVRRWLGSHRMRLKAVHLALIGLPIGFLTGLVVTTGPITAPLFLSAGLVKGAFVGTEAAASLVVYLSKAGVFQSFGALPWLVLGQGLIVGSSLAIGSFIAKRLMLQIPAERFRLLMDGLMLVSGLVMLWAAWR